MVNDNGEEMSKKATDKLGLSARAYDIIFKVSHTIAGALHSCEIVLCS